METPDLNIDKLYEKIRKLTNLKEGAEEIGSMEEAANAQARIQELVLKYNLDLSKVKANDDKVAEPEIIIVHHKIKFVKTESDWMPTLIHHIAVNNFGKAIFINRSMAARYGYWQVDIIAEKVNADLILYIFDQLVVRIKSMRAAAYKDVITNENPTVKKNGYFRSYSRAIVETIGWKLHEQKENLNKKYEGTNGLMIVQGAAINKKVQEEYGRLSAGKKSKALSNGYGQRDGKKDGHSMQINKGLN